MKKLLMWVVALTMGQAAPASTWWTSNPGSATSGSSYYIAAEASGANYLAELYIYKNGSFFASGNGYGWATAGDSTTDYGTQTVNYWADAYFDDYSWSETISHSVSITNPNTAPTIEWSQNPGSVPVNQWFTVEAHGHDSDGNLTNVFVWREWVPHAFGDGGNGYDKYCGNGSVSDTAGTVTFMAKAVDSNGAETAVIYHSVNIYVPNVAPTVTWVNNPPSSVYVNQSFNMQARANDGNGNLAWVYVWRDEQPFAFNAANGAEGYSDNNPAVGALPGTTGFKAKSGDTGGLESGFIYHNVTIVNRAPTVSASAASAVAGQPITVNWSAGDPDGNFSNVQVWVTQWGSPYWDYIGSFGASGSTQWSSSAHFNSSNPAAGAYLFVVRANDSAGAYTDAYATFDITNQSPNNASITAAVGSGVTYNSSGMCYEMWVDTPITLNATLHDGDGNLAFHAIYHNNGTGITDGSTWQQLTNGTPSNGTNSTLSTTYTPLIPGRWDFHTNGRDVAYAWSGGGSITTYVYGPTNNGQFVSQTVKGLQNPSSITVNPGEPYSVSITMRNNGEKPWTTDGTPHKLGAAGNGQVSPDAVALPVTVVNPLPQTNSDATFNFNATAPTAPGNYTCMWRMLEDGVQWFGAYTPAVTVTVNNIAPTATLSLNKATANVGESVTITMTVNDANQNMDYTNLWVSTPAYGWRWIHADNSLATGGALDRNHSATAYGASGTITRSFTFTLDQGFGTYTFALAAVDASGARTDAANQTITVANHYPFVVTSAASATINFGQTTTITATATDADGNLAFHGLLHLNQAGTNWFRGSMTDHSTGWGNHPVEAAITAASYASGVVSGSTSTRWIVHQPTWIGTNTYHSNTNDGIDWASSDAANWAACTGYVSVTVNKATPAGTFADRSFPGIHTLTAGDLTATFSNPYSSAVAPPTGTLTYSIVSASGQWASPMSGAVAVGTVLRAGSYVVRATYPGDANYNSASKDASFTVSLDPNADDDGDEVSNSLEITLGLNPYDATDVQVHTYTYDKINQLKTGPGGQYIKDAEGNIKEVRP